MRVVTIAAPLRHQVIEGLRDAISGGKYKPGERLTERELCDLFGVSRTSIREALRQLEAEGIVTMLPHRGPIVAPIDLKDAENIYGVRAALEALCVSQFATRSTHEERVELVRIADDIRAVAKSGGAVSEFLAVKKRFYDVLLNGTDNALAAGMIRAIHARASVLRATTLSSPMRMINSAEETYSIAVHLLMGDVNSAHAEMIRHIESAAKLARLVLGGRPASTE